MMNSDDFYMLGYELSVVTHGHSANPIIWMNRGQTNYPELLCETQYKESTSYQVLESNRKSYMLYQMVMLLMTLGDP